MCAAVQRIREMGVAPAAGPCHCGGIFARSARGGALATAAVDWCNRPSATEVEIGPLPAPGRGHSSQTRKGQSLELSADGTLTT